jgi:hypothetical protein
MSPALERRLLQVSVAMACSVSLAMGALSVIRSADVLSGMDPPFPTDFDSHYRYLSGLLLGIGLAFLLSVRRIERKQTIFRTLGAIVFVGGLARLWSLIDAGMPGPGHQFGLVMELVVTPLIVLWQARVARRCLMP